LNGRIWIFIGSVSAALAVGMGAWGAHGLESLLTKRFPANELDDIAKRLANWKTGTEYQMVYSLGLILIGTLIGITQRSRWLWISAGLMLMGIVFFSGMLYGGALFDVKWMVHVLPVGGVSLVAAWVVLAVAALGLKVSTPKV